MRRRIQRKKNQYILLAILLALIAGIAYAVSRYYWNGPLFNVAQVLTVIVLDASGSAPPPSSGSGASGGGGGGGGGAVLPETPPKDAAKGPAKGDLNHDGKVNLADFSVLAYWYKRPLTEAAIAAGVDLNHDGKVTLADFSIMAYYWNK